MTDYDAIIIGSGPNGLAAAITLAQNRQKVLVLEAKDTIGGGTRTAEITLPGFQHDICSAIHPLGIAAQPSSLTSGSRTFFPPFAANRFRVGMDLPARSAGPPSG